MTNTELNTALSSIKSFQEYEEFKTRVEVFESVAQEIISRHQLSKELLTLFSEGTNIVFAHGKHRVIKIYPSFHQEQFQSELLVMQNLQGKLSVKTPHVEYHGEIFSWSYIVMSQLQGVLLETLWETMEYDNKNIIIRELGTLICEVHALPTHGLEAIDCHWGKFIDKQIHHCVEQHSSTQLAAGLLQQIPSYIETIKKSLSHIKQPVILTGEYTPMNFLVKQRKGVWHIDGLIDFGDCMLGLPEYDLLGPGAFLIQGDKQLLKDFLMAYGYLSDAMTEMLSHKLTALMLLHKYSNLNIQVRIKDWRNKVSSLKDLEGLVWGF